jgi:hypothetical protein
MYLLLISLFSFQNGHSRVVVELLAVPGVDVNHQRREGGRLYLLPAPGYILQPVFGKFFKMFRTVFQIRSGSRLDPDSIGSADPDPDRSKLTAKKDKNLENLCRKSGNVLYRYLRRHI